MCVLTTVRILFFVIVAFVVRCQPRLSSEAIFSPSVRRSSVSVLFFSGLSLAMRATCFFPRSVIPGYGWEVVLENYNIVTREEDTLSSTKLRKKSVNLAHTFIMRQ